MTAIRPDVTMAAALERFQAKWKPVRVKKMRQIKSLEPRFDSIETEKALASRARYPSTVQAAPGFPPQPQ